MSDLSELFARDPLGLSDQDIDTIVARMREAQTQHDLGLKPSVPKAPKKSTKSEDLLKVLGLS